MKKKEEQQDACKKQHAYEKIAKEMILKIEPKLEICDDIIVGEYKKYKKYKNRKLEIWFSKEKREKKRKEHKELEIDYSKYTPKYKTIVIVLESPHTKEYANKKINPALGKTGKNLQTYFEKVFYNDEIAIDKRCNYRIILMNSIQFQCSLGLPTEVFRDHIWLNLWINQGFKNNFIGRLKSHNPDIIFNFCTQGDHSGECELFPDKLKKNKIDKEYIEYCLVSDVDELDFKLPTTLRELVSQAILEFISDKKSKSHNDNLKNMKFYEGPHPSSWEMIKKHKKNNKKNGKITIQDIHTKKEITITFGGTNGKQ